MGAQELLHHQGYVVSGLIAVVGTAALFIDYGRTLLPRAGDKIKPFDTPELKAMRPPLESMMEACGIKPVRDIDVP